MVIEQIIILQEMYHYIGDLIDRKVIDIKTMSESEKSTYVLCLLKVLCIAKQLEPLDASAIAAHWTIWLLNNIEMETEKGSFADMWMFDFYRGGVPAPLSVIKMETEKQILLEHSFNDMMWIFSFDRNVYPPLSEEEFIELNNLGYSKEQVEYGYIYTSVLQWNSDAESEEIIRKFAETSDAIHVAIEAIYDRLVETVGYNSLIYRIDNDVLLSCQTQFLNGKYKIPSCAKRICRNAFQKIKISGRFVIPETVEIIESGAFSEVIVEELLFEPRDSVLQIETGAFDLLTIKSGILHIQENIKLDSGAIAMDTRVPTIVYFDSSMKLCCENKIPIYLKQYGTPLMIYVVKDDFGDISLYIKNLGLTHKKSPVTIEPIDSNKVVFINERQRWINVKCEDSFLQKELPYPEAINRQIWSIAKGIDRFMIRHCDFIRDICLPVLDGMLTDINCYRLLRRLDSINKHSWLKHEIFKVIHRFKEDTDFQDEYFDIKDGVLVDYVPKGNNILKFYVRIPNSVEKIAADAFCQEDDYMQDLGYKSDFFKWEDLGVDYLILSSSSIHLETGCLEPLGIKKIFCDREYNKKKYISEDLNTYSNISVIYIDGLRSSENDSIFDIDGNVLKRCFINAKGRIDIPEGICSVSDKAFEDCACVTEISFPESVSYIGNDCFDGCIMLGKLIFSDNAKFIMEPSAWKKAPMLIDNYMNKKVVINGKTLVVYRDKDCPNYIVPSGVSVINNGAFAGRNMKTIELGEDVEYIGDYGLAYNSGLQSVKLPIGLQRIGHRILDHCPLSELYLPENFLVSEDNFQDIIGDPRNIGFYVMGIAGNVHLDIYTDNQSCNTDYSFKYTWYEGGWDRKHYEVEVKMHPQLKSGC